MKVLQIINTLATGGAEKLILETVPLLNEQKVKTDILVFKQDDYPFFETLKQLNSCKIYSLNFNSVYNPIIISKLTGIIQQYDIIHVHLFPAFYYVPISAFFVNKKLKLIFTEHNTTNRRMDNHLMKYSDRLVYKSYDKIICITKEIREIVKEHSKLSNEKLHIINNGVNLKIILEAIPYQKTEIHNSLLSHDRLILQVSSFTAQKDQDTLIKALQFLPSNFKVILVGSGPREKECKQLASSLNLTDRVFFLGTRTDVSKLLRSVDFVVLSSKYEGLSLSSIEGLASGSPFIASNVPGLKNVVEGAGLLFPLQDEKTLANIIQKLDNSPQLKNNVIQKCKERAMNYDIHSMVRKLIQTYKTLRDE